MSDKNSRDAFLYIDSAFSRGTPKLGNSGLRKFQYLCDESHVCRICYSEYSY